MKENFKNFISGVIQKSGLKAFQDEKPEDILKECLDNDAYKNALDLIVKNSLADKVSAELAGGTPADKAAANVLEQLDGSVRKNAYIKEALDVFAEAAVRQSEGPCPDTALPGSDMKAEICAGANESGVIADNESGAQTEGLLKYAVNTRALIAVLIAAAACFGAYFAVNYFKGTSVSTSNTNQSISVNNDDYCMPPPNIQGKNVSDKVFWAVNADKWGAYDKNAELTDVIIPDSVTSIGHRAFRDCVNLKRIQIPDSVAEIEDFAFRDCSSLESVKIPKKVASIKKCTFHNCTSLKEVILPEGLTHIGHAAFRNCSALAEIVIPDSVVTMDANVFLQCASLKRITFRGKVYTDYDEFNNDITKMNGKYVCVWGGERITDAVVPDGIAAIDAVALYRSVNLQSVKIPDSVTSVNDSAFKDCYRIKNIKLPDSVAYIDKRAFEDCSSLSSVNIPEGVAAIKEHTFANCYKLDNIVIPESVTYIGDCAFFNCSSLNSLVIPNSVDFIGTCAFWSCKNLKSIVISDNVHYIGKNVFEFCNNLNSITYKNKTYNSAKAFFKAAKSDGVTIE
ncbi:leucine-rich repeat domain-containing protein [bacterium]|nr:leucine-rich repeat domain-containing protein [bacterium]